MRANRAHCRTGTCTIVPIAIRTQPCQYVTPAPSCLPANAPSPSCPVDHYAGAEKADPEGHGPSRPNSAPSSTSHVTARMAPGWRRTRARRNVPALIMSDEKRIRARRCAHPRHHARALARRPRHPGSRRWDAATVHHPAQAPCSAADVATQIAALRETERAIRLDREIPVHVLIETHGALREVWESQPCPASSLSISV